jgi:hypothetical protein
VPRLDPFGVGVGLLCVAAGFDWCCVVAEVDPSRVAAKVYSVCVMADVDPFRVAAKVYLVCVMAGLGPAAHDFTSD